MDATEPRHEGDGPRFRLHHPIPRAKIYIIAKFHLLIHLTHCGVLLPVKISLSAKFQLLIPFPWVVINVWPILGYFLPLWRHTQVLRGITRERLISITWFLYEFGSGFEALSIGIFVFEIWRFWFFTDRNIWRHHSRDNHVTTTP